MMYDKMEELAQRAISLRNQYNETMGMLAEECGKYAYDNSSLCDVMGDDEMLITIKQPIDEEYYSFHGVPIYDFITHVRICGIMSQEAYLELRKIYSNFDEIEENEQAM